MKHRLKRILATKSQTEKLRSKNLRFNSQATIPTVLQMNGENFGLATEFLANGRLPQNSLAIGWLHRFVICFAPFTRERGKESGHMRGKGGEFPSGPMSEKFPCYQPSKDSPRKVPGKSHEGVHGSTRFEAA